MNGEKVPFGQPVLTPQFCFNTVALRDFLRLSRSTIDDSITQNLNALLTPSRDPFSPANISSTPRSPSSRRTIPSEPCSQFKHDLLFPSWKSRSDVIQYCASVAMSPDPDDPDLVAQQLENEKQKGKVIDDRLDPYSSRYFPRETRTERLAAVVRMEQGVEKIVRARTWAVVQERCEGEEGRGGSGWEQAFSDWERKRKTDADGVLA